MGRDRGPRRRQRRDLAEPQLLANLNAVQERHGISPDPAIRYLQDIPAFSLERVDYRVVSGAEQLP